MTANQIYVLLGIVSLIVAILSQVASRIFHTGKIMAKLEGMEDDIKEIKQEQRETRIWIRDNAIRGQARGR